MVKSLPSLQAWVAACAILLPCAPGMAQRPTPDYTSHADPRGRTATRRWSPTAISPLSPRATAHCTTAAASSRPACPTRCIEESISRRASRDARTVIDREMKIVSVYYASDMEPRIAAWRPGSGLHAAAHRRDAGWSRIYRACRIRYRSRTSTTASGRSATPTRPRRLPKAEERPPSPPCSTRLQEPCRHLSRAHVGRRHRRRAAGSSPSATSPVGTTHGRAHELHVQEPRRLARRHRRATAVSWICTGRRRSKAGRRPATRAATSRSTICCTWRAASTRKPAATRCSTSTTPARRRPRSRY